MDNNDKRNVLHDAASELRKCANIKRKSILSCDDLNYIDNLYNLASLVEEVAYEGLF